MLSVKAKAASSRRRYPSVKASCRGLEKSNAWPSFFAAATENYISCVLASGILLAPPPQKKTLSAFF